MDGMDASDSGLSIHEHECVVALVSHRVSSLQVWAAMRGASQGLRDTVGPAPMSLKLQLAAAHVSGLQGYLVVLDLGPVPLVCRHCGRRPRRRIGCLQHMVRVRPERRFCDGRSEEGQSVYIGAVCCAQQAAFSMQEQDWEEVKCRVNKRLPDLM
jgi:hypothetical protein